MQTTLNIRVNNTRTGSSSNSILDSIQSLRPRIRATSLRRHIPHSTLVRHINSCPNRREPDSTSSPPVHSDSKRVHNNMGTTTASSTPTKATRNNLVPRTFPNSIHTPQSLRHPIVPGSVGLPEATGLEGNSIRVTSSGRIRPSLRPGTRIHGSN